MSADSELLLEWRNDPEAVRFSVTGRGVAPGEHAEWLSARLADPGTSLWIAEEGGAAVGQVRVDLGNGTGTVSIGIAPAHRGRGVGSAVLQAMLVEIDRDPRARRLRAVAHAENTASVRAFERAGFRRRGRRERDFIVLERSVGVRK
jgi:UDP-2,4-diacetamido-2,4,6-trideoxy-beta-L-altropyranose hydrolase